MSEEDIVDSQNAGAIEAPASSEQESAAPVETAAPETASLDTSQEQSGVPSNGAPADSSQPPAGARPTALPTDSLKELNDFKAQAGRERAELQRQLQAASQQQQQWQRQEAQRQAEADRLKLKRWDPKHPQHHDFRGTLAKRNALSQQLRQLKDTLPPDQFAAVAQQMTDAALSAAEQTELQEHHQMNQDFLMNPMAMTMDLIRDHAGKMINEALQGFQQHSGAVKEVQRDLGAIPPHALGVMKEALESGASYDVSMKMAQMAAQLHELQGKQANAQQTTSQVSEQARLSKARATVSRDPKPAVMSRSDIYEKAKKIAESRGISTVDHRFATISAQVEAEAKAL